MNSKENKKEKRQLFNLIFENSREYGNFENGVTPPPNLTSNFENQKNVGYNLKIYTYRGYQAKSPPFFSPISL